MTSRFLLDPKVLDEFVSMPKVELEAQAAAYAEVGDGSQPNYFFYVDDLSEQKKKMEVSPLLNLPYLPGTAQGELGFHYRMANLLFMSVSEGDKQRWGSDWKSWRGQVFKKCEVLYVRGSFIKGNADLLKQYGISIVPLA